ncbi:putative membrane protein YgcG [Pseudomonas sp. Y3 TE3536]
MDNDSDVHYEFMVRGGGGGGGGGGAVSKWPTT